MDSSFFSQQMPYCLATLLVYMALQTTTTRKEGTISRIDLSFSITLGQNIFEVAIEFLNFKNTENTDERLARNSVGLKPLNILL